MRSTAHHGHGGIVNVLFQLLKFLLVILAIYTLKLRDQLEITLPATVAVINATPDSQVVSSPDFLVSFYALQFFGQYDTVTATIRLYNSSGKPLGDPKPGLPSPRVDSQGHEHYLHSITFTLPEPGDYEFDYTVQFDPGNQKRGSGRNAADHFKI